MAQRERQKREEQTAGALSREGPRGESDRDLAS